MSSFVQPPKTWRKVSQAALLVPTPRGNVTLAEEEDVVAPLPSSSRGSDQPLPLGVAEVDPTNLLSDGDIVCPYPVWYEQVISERVQCGTSTRASLNAQEGQNYCDGGLLSVPSCSPLEDRGRSDGDGIVRQRQVSQEELHNKLNSACAGLGDWLDLVQSQDPSFSTSNLGEGSTNNKERQAINSQKVAKVKEIQEALRDLSDGIEGKVGQAVRWQMVNLLQQQAQEKHRLLVQLEQQKATLRQKVQQRMKEVDDEIDAEEEENSHNS